VKYHHFWDAHDQGRFEILPIPTKYQCGDYMMKGANGMHTFQAQPFLGAVVVKQPLLMNDW
jgi:hypothetical protein